MLCAARPCVRRPFSSAPLQGLLPGAAGSHVESGLPLPSDFGIEVLPCFVSSGEEAALEAFCAPLLRRRPWEASHFDAVIAHYREAQFLARRLPPVASGVVGRALRCLPAPSAAAGVGLPMEELHALELGAQGYIDAHVDSVKFSGGVVAGLCLRSDAVMRLSLAEDAAAAVAAAGGAQRAPVAAAWLAGAPPPGSSPPPITLLLPRGCLYILTREARYCWGHAVPLEGSFQGRPVRRSPAGRLSIMLRDHLPASSSSSSSSSAALAQP